MPDNMGTDFAISSKTFEKLREHGRKFSLPGSAEYATTQICSSSTPSRVTSQTLQVRPSTLSDLPVSATSTVRGVPLSAGAAQHLLHLRALLGRQLGHLFLHLLHLRRELLRHLFHRGLVELDVALSVSSIMYRVSPLISVERPSGSTKRPEPLWT